MFMINVNFNGKTETLYKNIFFLFWGKGYWWSLVPSQITETNNDVVVGMFNIESNLVYTSFCFYLFYFSYSRLP